ALLLGCLLLLDRSERRARDLLLLSALIGVAPWFHFKNALPFGLVAAVAFVQVVRGSRGAARVRRCPLLVLPALLITIGYELTVHDWYGSWLPSRMIPPGPDLLAISPLRGIAATSFDSARGLLSNNPALLLVLAGLPIWFVRFRRRFLPFAFVVGP